MIGSSFSSRLRLNALCNLETFGIFYLISRLFAINPYLDIERLHFSHFCRCMLVIHGFSLGACGNDISKVDFSILSFQRRRESITQYLIPAQYMR